MQKNKGNEKLTIDGFGDEWSRFDQAILSENEANKIFSAYFSLFPWSRLPKNAIGFDLGCGSGRWAKLVAPRVGRLHCVDPSNAIDVAKKNLSNQSNCEFHRLSVNELHLKDCSMDFGYSLGVLHHIYDTQSALNICIKKLKPGAPFLLYLYYALDNRPKWFKIIWVASDNLRQLVSILPLNLRYILSQLLAIFIYWPLARTAKLLEKLNINISNFPLMTYRNYSFYVMRTDDLDRFGTRIEKRFSKDEILKMMEIAGLEKIIFSKNAPFWCAIGYAKEDF